MGVIGTQRILESEASPGLFERIGRFLAEQRLSPEPAHYTFAYHVMSDPEGPLARAVETLTDGGVRLSRKDIVSLGGEAVAGPTVELVAPAPARNTAPEEEQPNPAALIDRAKEHVDDFADTVRAIHVETRGFGRDIAASAAAIRRQGAVEGMDEIARLTGAMLDRVRQAEARLEAATRETEALRSALDEARDSARHDPLTELANRRAFDEAYAALVPGTAVVVAVCDIDYFKWAIACSRRSASRSSRNARGISSRASGARNSRSCSSASHSRKRARSSSARAPRSPRGGCGCARPTPSSARSPFPPGLPAPPGRSSRRRRWPAPTPRSTPPNMPGGTAWISRRKLAKCATGAR